MLSNSIISLKNENTMCLEFYSEIKLDSHLQGWPVLFFKKFQFLNEIKRKSDMWVGYLVLGIQKSERDFRPCTIIAKCREDLGVESSG